MHPDTLFHPPRTGCQLLYAVFPEDGQLYVIADQLLIMVGICIAQQQYLLFQPCTPQDERLLRGSHGIPPHIVKPFQLPGDLHRAVTVGVRLDHTDHLRTGRQVLPHLLHIIGNGVQIDHRTYTLIFR